MSLSFIKNLKKIKHMIKRFFHSYSTVVVGFIKSTNLEKCIHIFCFSILCIKETLLKAAVIKLFKQYIIVDFHHTKKKKVYMFLKLLTYFVFVYYGAYSVPQPRTSL